MNEVIEALIRRQAELEARLAAVERRERPAGVTTSHTHSSLAASDGRPDPGANVTSAGRLQALYGFTVTDASPTDVYSGQLDVRGTETTGAANTGGCMITMGSDGSVVRTLTYIRGMKENSTVGDAASYIALATRPDSSTAPREVARFDSRGRLTLPYQVSFLAYNSLTYSNVTGDGTTVTVNYDTEVFDIGGYFGNDMFTAPVTGRYLLTATVALVGLTSSHTQASINIVTSLRTYSRVMNPYTMAYSGQYTAHHAMIVNLNAGNTAYITVSVSGGSKVVDIYGASIPSTAFSGILLG